jgi:hypothetical protein
MDSPFSLTLRTISGGCHSVSVTPSMTVREVLAFAHLDSPPNSIPLVLRKNIPLHLDLSLGHQKIASSETVGVLLSLSINSTDMLLDSKLKF